MPRDELAGKTSDEVKQMLLNTPGESDGQDFETLGDYELQPSDVEAPVRPTLDDQVEQAEQARQQATLEYLERKVVEQGGQDAFTQNLDQAIASDWGDLVDRYGEAVGSDVMNKFQRDFAKGRVKPSEEEMLTFDNPHEQTFLRWLSRPSVMRELSQDQIADCIRVGAGLPLRSKSKAIVAPSFMHPERKFKG